MENFCEYDFAIQTKCFQFGKWYDHMNTIRPSNSSISNTTRLDLLTSVTTALQDLTTSTLVTPRQMEGDHTTKSTKNIAKIHIQRRDGLLSLCFAAMVLTGAKPATSSVG